MAPIAALFQILVFNHNHYLFHLVFQTIEQSPHRQLRVLRQQALRQVVLSPGMYTKESTIFLSFFIGLKYAERWEKLTYE